MGVVAPGGKKNIVQIKLGLINGVVLFDFIKKTCLNKSDLFFGDLEVRMTQNVTSVPPIKILGVRQLVISDV